MKPVLWVLAALLCTAVWTTGPPAVSRWHVDYRAGTPSLDASEPSARIADPHDGSASGLPGMVLEREKSIRLFGPGLSRKQQIRV